MNEKLLLLIGSLACLLVGIIMMPKNASEIYNYTTYVFWLLSFFSGFLLLKTWERYTKEFTLIPGFKFTFVSVGIIAFIFAGLIVFGLAFSGGIGFNTAFAGIITLAVIGTIASIGASVGIGGFDHTLFSTNSTIIYSSGTNGMLVGINIGLFIGICCYIKEQWYSLAISIGLIIIGILSRYLYEKKQ